MARIENINSYSESYFNKGVRSCSSGHQEAQTGVGRALPLLCWNRNVWGGGVVGGVGQPPTLSDAAADRNADIQMPVAEREGGRP